MFWRKRQPLLHCEIVHALPGRVRIRCRALGYLGTYVAEIRQRLQDLSPIRQARVNILTQNVLLHYDHTQVSAQDVLELAELVIGSYSLTAYKAERAEQNRPTVNERRLQEGSLSDMLIRIGVTTATLVFYFFRKPAGHGPATLCGPLPHRSVADGRLAGNPHLPQRPQFVGNHVSSERRYAQRHRDSGEHRQRPGSLGADDHLAGRHRRTAHRLYDGPHPPRDPQHAFGRRRDRLAVAGRRRRGARGPRSTPRRRPDHGPHRREDQRGRGGGVGRGGGRSGVDYRRIHALAQGRRATRCLPEPWSRAAGW